MLNNNNFLNCTENDPTNAYIHSGPVYLLGAYEFIFSLDLLLK